MYNLEQAYDLIGIKKYLVDDNEERVCRFCGLKKGETFFHKEAHAVSDFLNNESLFTKYECDSCNDKFSKLEKELANYFYLYRALRKYNKKHGTVSMGKCIEIKHDKEKKSSELKVRDGFINGDNGFSFSIEEDGIVFERTADYDLLSCYKALVKFGLSVLEQGDVRKCKRYIDFLLKPNTEESNNIQKVFYYQLLNAEIENPQIRIYKKKSELALMPNFLIGIDFGNYKFYVFLLTDDENITKCVEDTMILPFFSNTNCSFSVDCSKNHKIEITQCEKLLGKSMKINLKEIVNNK